MSDEQIIKTLKNIQAYCAHAECCEGCKFKYGKEGEYCQFEELGEQIRFVPSMWALDEVKKILEK